MNLNRLLVGPKILSHHMMNQLDNSETPPRTSTITRHRVEGRVIRARLDFPNCRLLIQNYGFPKSLIARTLRLRLEQEGDDFKSFFDFYQAVEDTAKSLGIQPPGMGRYIQVNGSSEMVLSQLRDDGTFVDESCNTTEFWGPGSDGVKIARPSIPSACWNCQKAECDHVTIPCGHCSYCKVCASKKIRFCIQCNRHVEEIIKIFRS